MCVSCNARALLCLCLCCVYWNILWGIFEPFEMWISDVCCSNMCPCVFSDLIHCTNEMNVNVPQLADTLFERTANSSWVVVFKALITTHHLMMYGNEVRDSALVLHIFFLLMWAHIFISMTPFCTVIIKDPARSNWPYMTNHTSAVTIFLFVTKHVWDMVTVKTFYFAVLLFWF